MGYTSIKVSVITLGYFFMLFVTFTSILNPIFASKICEFPAIFNLGDSNSDTGTLSAAFTPPNSPYGDTYFHMPAGRYSDGRLIIDFMAKSFNLPFLSAYLNSLGTSYTHGANFASARGTIRFPSPIIPANGGYSPFYLDVQYQQFMQFKERSQIIRKQGGKFAKLMPEEEYFREALYTFDFGLNDIGAAIFSNMSIEEVKANIPDIVNTFSIYVKTIDKLIETGDSEQIFQKAIQEQGRGQITDTLAEIQERHDAVRDLERKLLDLQQIFLDMAVLVDAQGDMLDNIESQVSNAVDHVQSGNVALQKAKKLQRNSRKWMCIAIIILLIIVVIIVVAVVKPWNSKKGA